MELIILKQFFVDLIFLKNDLGLHIFLEAFDALHDVPLFELLLDLVLQHFFALFDLLLLLNSLLFLLLLPLFSFQELLLHFRVDFLINHWSFHYIFLLESNPIFFQEFLFILLCEFSVILLWKLLFGGYLRILCSV